MGLFYLIIFLAFLNQYIQKIVSFVTLKLIGMPAEVNNRLNLVKEMMNELSSISMTDEWARYAKLQRKINKENDELAKIMRDKHQTESNMTLSICRICNIVLGLIVTYTVYNYRTSVVAQVPENWFWPLNWLLCWSKDVPGGITVPCWVIISYSFFRTVSRIHQ